MAGQANMFQPARVKEVSVGVARLTLKLKYVLILLSFLVFTQCKNGIIRVFLSNCVFLV